MFLFSLCLIHIYNLHDSLRNVVSVKSPFEYIQQVFACQIKVAVGRIFTGAFECEEPTPYMYKYYISKLYNLVSYISTMNKYII